MNTDDSTTLRELPATSTSSGQSTLSIALTGFISTVFGSKDDGCCGGGDGDDGEPALPPPTGNRNLAAIEQTFVLFAVGFKHLGKDDRVDWNGVSADIERWNLETLTALDALSQSGLVQRESRKYQEWFKSQKQE